MHVETNYDQKKKQLCNYFKEYLFEFRTTQGDRSDYWILSEKLSDPIIIHRNPRNGIPTGRCRKVLEWPRFLSESGHSDTFRHPTTSCRNPIPRIPTTSDGLLSDPIKSDSFSNRIRPGPTVGSVVLGRSLNIMSSRDTAILDHIDSIAYTIPL